MFERGLLLLGYVTCVGGSTVLDVKKLKQEGTASALGAAVEQYILQAMLEDKCEGGRRTEAHIKAGLNKYRCCITAPPISCHLSVENYRMEPLHAGLNMVNGLIELTALYYAQLEQQQTWPEVVLSLGLKRPIQG